MTDPQFDDTDPEVEAFINDLAAVFGHRDFEVQLLTDGHVFAQLVGYPEVTIERTGRTMPYYVTFGSIVGIGKTVKAATDSARSAVTVAVAALESVGWQP